MQNSSRTIGRAARHVIRAGTTGALALALCACDAAATTRPATQGPQSATTAQDATATAPDTTQDASAFSERDLDATYDEATATKVRLEGDTATVDGPGATADASTVTITDEGTYLISGKTGDGRIVIDANESAKVRLVLDGADLTSSTGTALYAREADRVFVTLAPDSTNAMRATGNETTDGERTLDGTLFATCDLTVNGKGSLQVTSASGNGIVGKDELRLVDGDIEVTSGNGTAIQANDGVAVRDGSYVLEAGRDCIHAEDEAEDKGWVLIRDGTLDMRAQSDGIDASGDVTIKSGRIAIAANDDGIHAGRELTIDDGTIDVTESTEALEGGTVTVNGGDIKTKSSDDGINATGTATTGETGQERQKDLTGTDGTETRKTPPAMPEDEPATRPDMPGDDVSQSGADGMDAAQRPPHGQQAPPTGDDGQTQATERPDGRDHDMQTPPDTAEGDMPPRVGGQGADDPLARDDTAMILINGGSLRIDANGDGLDSNGSIEIKGGTTLVDGPTGDGNGAIDCPSGASVTGGTVMAIGSAGMAQGFAGSSTQCWALLDASGDAGDRIALRDRDGRVLVETTTTKPYACVLVSSPDMVEGGTYELSHGDGTTTVELEGTSYSNVRAQGPTGLRRDAMADESRPRA